MRRVDLNEGGPHARDKNHNVALREVSLRAVLCTRLYGPLMSARVCIRDTRLSPRHVVFERQQCIAEVKGPGLALLISTDSGAI